jgi:ribonuclease Z
MLDHTIAALRAIQSRRFVPLAALRQTGIGLVASAILLGCAPLAPDKQDKPAQAPAITVTLLGTGTPEPETERFGASTLVEAGGMRFLFDAGRGATIRLAQIKVPVGSIEATFITHFHSDHTAGLPDVWLTGLLPGFGGRKNPMTIIGPVGTQQLVSSMAQAYQTDIQIRAQEIKLDPVVAAPAATEFDKGGVVFDKGGVKVTAFAVDHGAFAKPAYGYRLDYDGKSVLISGDTRYDANVIQFGKGVDLMLHEVAEAPEAMKSLPITKAIMGLHTSPEECGQIFTLTQPKMAAYTHLALLRNPQNPPVTTAIIEANTRKTYQGPLVVGQDLTRFEIGEQVRALRWDAQKKTYAPI